MVYPNEWLHINMYCPQCHIEMTKVEFTVESKRKSALGKVLKSIVGNKDGVA